MSIGVRMRIVVACWLFSLGMAAAQSPVIASFSQNGRLVCTNLAPGSTAVVEWSPAAAGPWSADWTALQGIAVGGSGAIEVNVPMFYRVRGTVRGGATAITLGAISVTTSGATLRGSAIPNGSPATGWFRYSTVHPGSANDTFGTRAPASGGAALGASTNAQNFSQTITGLLPGTTYYYCAMAQNAEGIAFGTVQSFTTTPVSPTVATGSASGRTGTSATLNGTVNPGGDSTTAWFRYSTVSPGTANDTFGTRAPASGGSAVAAGSSAVAVSQSIAGLTPGTTYFYCAIAQNSVGTGFGALQTFTTPGPPVAVTLTASGLTSGSATLNGTGNPNGAGATGWFRYSTVNPGVASDTFGLRAPASGGLALGAGTAAQGFSQSIAGLTPGTTYYFCAIVQSAEGLALGTVQTFTTPGAPTATTLAATGVSSSGATLQGNANPNGANASGWFRYSTVNPGSANDTFGTRAPASGGAALGGGTSAQNFSQALAGLLPATTYYYCAVAANAEGVAFGAIRSFTTTPTPPSVATGSATGRTGTSATLNGTVNPGGDASTAWFRYSTVSPGTANDTFGTRAPASGGSAIAAGSSSVAVSQAIAGLSPGTTYFYCAIAQNSVGTGFGTLQTFTTPTPPTVLTVTATNVVGTSATLRAAGNPNGATTVGWFRYSTVNPGVANDSAGTRAPSSGGTALGSGSGLQTFSQTISGLSPGTTYYFWSLAQSPEGTAFGNIQSFTTP